ncbi:hypothetical protein CR513_19719, partial [Mucuna pruriens]
MLSLSLISYVLRLYRSLKKGLTITFILQAPDWEFPFDLIYKFYSYLLASKIIVFFDYATLKFLLKKFNAKPRLIRFDIEIKDKSGVENLIVDHLSIFERRIDPLPIRDDFPNEQLIQLDDNVLWFNDIVNYIVAYVLPPKVSRSHKDKIKSDAKYYVWDDPYLWKFCSD